MRNSISRRLATANPKSKTPLAEPGIVLIDEIELHFHPALQARVIGDLTATFPGCQFIASTHSPEVIGHVRRGAVWGVARKPSGGYTVEMAIPWADLGIAAPPAGTRIGLDLAHNDVDVPGAGPKQADWAGLTAFAQPGKWLGGRLESAPACSAPDVSSVRAPR